jgi:uncharacterized Zn-finger protein
MTAAQVEARVGTTDDLAPPAAATDPPGDAGAAPCPYCLWELAAGPADARDCPSCGARYHHDCWAENGGCAVFGCAGWAASYPIAGGDSSAAPAPVAPDPVEAGEGPANFCQQCGNRVASTFVFCGYCGTRIQ